jgi:hypothetical protein
MPVVELRGRDAGMPMTQKHGSATRALLAAATLVSGVLAGGVVDRVVVGGPAWHELGADAWAQYSRYADLGTGLLAYPIEAIGAALLIVATIVSGRRDGDRWRRTARPLYWALVFSLAGLALTVKAAPIMLGLGKSLPAAAIQTAFDDFFLWGLYLRGLADVLAFAALVWALTIPYRVDET